MISCRHAWPCGSRAADQSPAPFGTRPVDHVAERLLLLHEHDGAEPRDPEDEGHRGAGEGGDESGLAGAGERSVLARRLGVGAALFAWKVVHLLRGGCGEERIAPHLGFGERGRRSAGGRVGLQRQGGRPVRPVGDRRDGVRARGAAVHGVVGLGRRVERIAESLSGGDVRPGDDQGRIACESRHRSTRGSEWRPRWGWW